MFKNKPNYFFDVCWAFEMNFRLIVQKKINPQTPKHRIKLNPEAPGSNLGL